ncbi:MULTISPECIES: purine-nucleoside phosphorylase [Eubacteriales]|uniref:Uridine phosphorylase n=2 Tax=Clostridia TaxID=186801 RepID=A0AAP1LH55_9FIRM|nr:MULTISPECIES: purine-nucleoside phosphorylase [Eubacteriales]MCB5941989.1 purine-nucleoside phosphorylase [bacterium 210820-DFI.6.52]MBC2871292.1 purine-nucleoside phosphorylase [Bittarella massiliensis (ex Durand et al. 2017)]MCQ4949391.1 purine-nucleoside phosphorylase [Bittarella massiliensis (ex Durand et al. 2017)]MZL69651.1 purine-nucleoside phosphorylase [Bittarella massiliensis (ex Durand et al. 2017)]MZL81826.1 purine-nucleoside phosphorylase [Bittarella massiliensis (ex Durand et 
MSTPHNTAEKGQIASTVLMPGDPLRAKYIAETYLDNVSEFNHVRGMLGFTGTYQGKPVSVMGSGMGIPSIGIYSYELFHHYGVDNIIRLGSSGSYVEGLNLFDVVMATAAWSASTYALAQSGYDKDLTYPSTQLNAQLKESAQRLGKELVEGVVHSSDVFYYHGVDKAAYIEKLNREHGCICIDMESFALFHNAALNGKRAATLLTISDTLKGEKQSISSADRELALTNMMEIALGIL